MDIQAAILCDFAQVRGGLLFISSGVVSRVVVSKLPAHLPLTVALVVEVLPPEIGSVHEARVAVTHDGKMNGQAVLSFQAKPGIENSLETGETVATPAAVSLWPIQVESTGLHDVRVSINGGTPKILSFYALSR